MVKLQGQLSVNRNTKRETGQKSEETGRSRQSDEAKHKLYMEEVYPSTRLFEM